MKVNDIRAKPKSTTTLQHSHHTDQAAQDGPSSNDAPVQLRTGHGVRSRPSGGRAGRRTGSGSIAPGEGGGARHGSGNGLGNLRKAGGDGDAPVRGGHRLRDGGAVRGPRPAVTPDAPASPARVVAVAAGADPGAPVPRAAGHSDLAGGVARSPAAPAAPAVATLAATTVTVPSEPAPAGAAPAVAVAAAWAPACGAGGAGPGHGVDARGADG